MLSSNNKKKSLSSHTPPPPKKAVVNAVAIIHYSLFLEDICWKYAC